MIISSGKYFTKAISTRLVKVKFSTMACVLACLINFGSRKRVTRCFVLVDILPILQLYVVLVK